MGKGLFIIFTRRLCSCDHTNILSFVFMKTEILSISNSTSACAKFYLHGKRILHGKLLKNAQFLHPPPSYFRLKIIADLIGTSYIEKKEPKIQVSSERIEGERIVLIYFLSDVILGGWVGELSKRHMTLFMTLFELKIDL